MTPGRLPREEREDARVGARGGGLLRHAAALAWKLLSPAARAAAFAVEETIPRPVARVFAASLCCPGDQGAGRHPAGGARGEKRRSLAGGRVGARPRNGIRGTWWRRLDPGEVSASDPPAPSCLLNAAPPPHPTPLPAAHTAVFQSAFRGVGGGGGRHVEGVGFREAQTEEAVK